MKKIICLLFVFFCITEGFAKNKSQTKAPELKGIWQLCLPVSSGESHSLKTLPVIKVLSGDKTFNNIALNLTKGSVITTRGTWKKKSGDTYIEKIHQSATDPRLVGHTILLHYKMVNPRLLEVSYKLGDGSRVAKEFWVKLDLPASVKRINP